ncbi:hypothetical protein SmJEL517_g05683 [Synchytrium microbalum]|uniref:BRISC and BRCA1-A complex member 2 n=1 Tax=Synchytrium microbalum TaxID=1806994 RepID=A0A507BZZ4_9FUNG|nr:uncharacterized protein SmJEL517_g05683 [Synchytrium microbalum]TPX30843.1 hypothetical protein SmJEL517_g05683 [Synchytrium microbalum]
MKNSTSSLPSLNQLNDLSSYVPFVQPHIKNVLSDERHHFDVGNPRPSSYTHETVGACTRFDVKIWFCGEARLSCEVFYDPYDPQYPPDVIITSLANDTSFVVTLDQIQSYMHWDALKPDCLLTMLQNIRGLYSEYQKAQVANVQVPKLQFDCSTIQHNPAIDFMILAGGSMARFEIPIRIPLEADDMAEFFKSPFENPEIEAHVTLTYHMADCEVRTVDKKIELPEAIEKERDMLFKMPPFDRETPLVDFIESVEKILIYGRDIITQRKGRKKSFMQALTLAFQDHLLEYDEINFSVCALYLELAAPNAPTNAGTREGAHAFVLIHLPESFPRTPPLIFMLHPYLYRGEGGHAPYQVELKMPYDFRHTNEQLLARIKGCLMEQIPLFNLEATKSGKP